MWGGTPHSQARLDLGLVFHDLRFFFESRTGLFFLFLLTSIFFIRLDVVSIFVAHIVFVAIVVIAFDLFLWFCFRRGRPPSLFTWFGRPR